mmetsp:Transcript_10841/g.36161  ORF Transcript_10841/g.36161 Transcript_10841/m.36161 type:complete len:289 (-) Transcript_10841:408-1274(-)
MFEERFRVLIGADHYRARRRHLQEPRHRAGEECTRALLRQDALQARDRAGGLCGIVGDVDVDHLTRLDHVKGCRHKRRQSARAEPRGEGSCESLLARIVLSRRSAALHGRGDVFVRGPIYRAERDVAPERGREAAPESDNALCADDAAQRLKVLPAACQIHGLQLRAREFERRDDRRGDDARDGAGQRGRERGRHLRLGVVPPSLLHPAVDFFVRSKVEHSVGHCHDDSRRQPRVEPADTLVSRDARQRAQHRLARRAQRRLPDGFGRLAEQLGGVVFCERVLHEAVV